MLPIRTNDKLILIQPRADSDIWVEILLFLKKHLKSSRVNWNHVRTFLGQYKRTSLKVQDYPAYKSASVQYPVRSLLVSTFTYCEPDSTGEMKEFTSCNEWQINTNSIMCWDFWLRAFVMPRKGADVVG